MNRNEVTQQEYDFLYPPRDPIAEQFYTDPEIDWLLKDWMKADLNLERD